MLYYYLRLIWNIFTFKCCRTRTKVYETINFEEQDESECFMCQNEYKNSDKIVLLHGIEYPTHNICENCVKTFKLTECPFCREPLV